MPYYVHNLAGSGWFAAPDTDRAVSLLLYAQTMIAIALVAALVLLLIVYVRGRELYRRWVAARLRRQAELHIAKSDEVREGMPVTLEAPYAGETISVRSAIAYTHRRWIAIEHPNGFEWARMPVGAPVTVTVAAPTTAFRFPAILQDRRIVEGRRLFFVARPSWVERVQRREFFRIRVELPTVVSPVAPTSEEPRVWSGTVDDLSGGGFRVRLSSQLDAGSRVRIRLPDTALGGAAFEARVICCQPYGLYETDLYEARCEFLYMREEVRNRIVNYCFGVQRAGIRAQRGLD